MGVPGLWDLLRPAGETHSLTHLAVTEGFEANKSGRRALRVGVDASIWFYHSKWGKEGENPELRTLFFRCCRQLLDKPFLPVFVFDGPLRPEEKRGKRISRENKHWLVDSMKGMIKAFGFEWRMAPGEAEAELAYLNETGVIDAVWSDDVDNFLFGATMVIRNSSKKLSGNKSHSTKNSEGLEDGNHTAVYRSDAILRHPSINLSRGGMILIALLSGGDYHQAGVTGCGPGFSHGLARCGLGDQLLQAARSMDDNALQDFLIGWRQSLRDELKTNASGYLPSKRPSLVKAVSDTFPDISILRSYTNPITSKTHSRTQHQPPQWADEPDLGQIGHVCELHFEWGLKDIILDRFSRVLWPGAVFRVMRRAVLDDDEGKRSSATRHMLSGLVKDVIVKIHSTRCHASTDNLLEYRLEIAPAQLVKLVSSGLQGTRTSVDTTYDVNLSDFDDDDEEEEAPAKRKKKKEPGDPDACLRVWMPATIVTLVRPDLVEEYNAKEEVKKAKKNKPPGRAAGVKAKVPKKTATTTRRKKQPASAAPFPLEDTAEEEQEEETPPPVASSSKVTLAPFPLEEPEEMSRITATSRSTSTTTLSTTSTTGTTTKATTAVKVSERQSTTVKSFYGVAKKTRAPAKGKGKADARPAVALPLVHEDTIPAPSAPRPTQASLHKVPSVIEVSSDSDSDPSPLEGPSSSQPLPTRDVSRIPYAAPTKHHDIPKHHSERTFGRTISAPTLRPFPMSLSDASDKGGGDSSDDSFDFPDKVGSASPGKRKATLSLVLEDDSAQEGEGGSSGSDTSIEIVSDARKTQRRSKEHTSPRKMKPSEPLPPVDNASDVTRPSRRVGSTPPRMQGSRTNVNKQPMPVITSPGNDSVISISSSSSDSETEQTPRRPVALLSTKVVPPAKSSTILRSNVPPLLRARQALSTASGSSGSVGSQASVRGSKSRTSEDVIDLT